MNGCPDPADDSLPVAALERIDRICLGFESAWKAGKPPRIEDYLGDTQAAERAELLRQLLLLDLDYRRLKAHRPTLEEYQARFPDKGKLVAEVFGEFSIRAASSPPPGTKVRYFGDYELLEEVGHGGMGVVYKARQISLNRIVAVKMILPGRLTDEAAVKRFRAEAEAAANLQHPNIVAVHEVGVHDGKHYFSMDYVEGKNLAEMVRENPLPAKRAAEYVHKIAEAVHYAHQQGTLHRDLKPSNVLIDPADQPRITDFGLAKRLESDSDLTIPGQILGTLGYMPPEQAWGKEDELAPASDVHALGATLYELVAGRPPFRAATAADTLLLVREAEPVSPRLLNPKVPRDLETICLKCLEKEPSKRYAAAEGLADDLERYLGGKPIQARPVSRAERLWRWCRRKPLVAALSGTAVLLLVAVAVVGMVGYVTTSRALEGETEQRLRADAKAAEALAAQHLAQRREKEARDARRDAEAALYRSRLSETRALRLAKPPGWSTSAFENLRLNALIDIPERKLDELRTEAMRCMGELDVREVARFDRTDANVRSIDFSPDGMMLAGVCYNRGLLVWDLRQKELVREIRDPGARRFQQFTRSAPYPAVRFHPSGAYLAYGSWNHSVRFIPFDATEAELPAIVSTEQPQSLAFDGTGDLMAVAWSDCNVTVHDLTAGKVLREIATGAEYRMRGPPVALSPHGNLLATLGRHNAIMVHSMVEQREPVLLGHHHDEVTALSFSPDGRLVASCSNDRTARVFDLESGKETVRLLGHTARVKCVAFSTDGSLIATASDDRTVRLWDCETGQPLMLLRPRLASVISVAFSPDGEHLAAAKRGAVLFRLTNRKAKRVLRGHNYSVQGLAFHPSEPLLISGCWEKRIILWDLSSGRPRRRWIGHPNKRIEEIAVSHDGQLIATGHGSYSNLRSNDHTVRVWELATGNLCLRLEGHTTGVDAVAFPPSGRRFVSGDTRGTTILWNLSTGEKEQQWGQPGDAVRALAFLGDGSKLLAAYSSGGILIRDLPAGQITGEYRVLEKLTDAAVSPDEQHLAVATHEGHIYLLTLAPSALIRTLTGGHQGAVSAVAFSSDGRLMATAGADRRVKVWDFLSRRKLFSFPRQDSPILNLAFEPTGHRLAICGVEQHVTVWDLVAVRDQFAAIGLDWEPPLDLGEAAILPERRQVGTR